ncbi:hypothetical protein P9112_010717 [Eukaryota sp. TZLM1-RC]
MSLYNYTHSTVCNETKNLVEQWISDLNVPSHLFSSTESLAVPKAPPPPPPQYPRRNVRQVPDSTLLTGKKEDDIVIQKAREIRNLHSRKKKVIEACLNPNPNPNFKDKSNRVRKVKKEGQINKQGNRNPQKAQEANKHDVTIPEISSEFHCVLNQLETEVVSKRQIFIFFSWFLNSSCQIFRKRSLYHQYFNIWDKSLNNLRLAKEDQAHKYYIQNLKMQNFCQWRINLEQLKRTKQIENEFTAFEIKRKGFLTKLRTKQVNTSQEEAQNSQENSEPVTSSVTSPSRKSLTACNVVNNIDERHNTRKKQRDLLQKRYLNRKLIEKEMNLMKINDDLSLKLEIVRRKREEVKIKKEKARLLTLERHRQSEINHMNLFLAQLLHKKLRFLKVVSVFRKNISVVNQITNHFDGIFHRIEVSNCFYFWKDRHNYIINRKFERADLFYSKYLQSKFLGCVSQYCKSLQRSRSKGHDLMILIWKRHNFELWKSSFRQCFKNRLILESEMEQKFRVLFTNIELKTFFLEWNESLKLSESEKASKSRISYLMSRAEQYLNLLD